MSRHWRSGSLIAFFTIEKHSHVLLTAFRRRDPRTILPGRLVADVLRMAAREVSHPVLLIVGVKSYDGLLHNSYFDVIPSTKSWERDWN